MSDSTPRDQLAQIIYDTLNGQYGDFCMPDDAADAILEAGWRPPARTVTTVEELDALPEGTMIRDSEGTVAENWDGTWYVTGAGRYWNEDLPATVLYEPEEGAGE